MVATKRESALRLVWIFVIALIASFALMTLINYYAHGQAEKALKQNCQRDAIVAGNVRTMSFALIQIVSAEMAEKNHVGLQDPTLVNRLQEALDRIPEYNC